MQEEKDDLRARAMASVSKSPQNPNPDNPPSSDDDALPASSVTPSTSISAPPSSSIDASTKSYVQAIGQSASSHFGSQSPFGQNNVTSSPFATKPFGATPFGSQTGASIFGSTSTWVFGQSSSPLSSTLACGVTSSPGFGSSTPLFGSTASSVGGSSALGQKPAFGGFGSTTQTSPFGSSFKQSQPAFDSKLFGSSSPFNASSQSAFGGTSSPAFGSSTTSGFGGISAPSFGSTPTPTFGSAGTGFGVDSTSAFGSGGAFRSMSTSVFGAATASAFGGNTAPAFGATTTPTLGATTASAFGAASSTPAVGATTALAFGGGSTPSFGSNSNPSFRFATSSAFGRSTSGFGSTPFGSTPPYGGPSFPFGAQATTPIFGSGGLGQSTLGVQSGETRVAQSAPTQEADSGRSSQPAGKLESIPAMQNYKDGSRETVEPPKRKQAVSLICDLCNVNCGSQFGFECHIVGKKHLKRVQGHHKKAYGEGKSVSANLPATSPLPNVKLDTTGRAARNEGKVAPKKAPEQRSGSKNSIAASRISSSKNRGASKNVDLCSSKIQDLHQQIAMLENKPKLKIVMKNKENVRESCKDVNVMRQNKNTSKKSREFPSDVWTESKEPDKKRLKSTQNGSEQPGSSGRHVKLAESLVLGQPLLKNPSCGDENTANHVHHNTHNLLKELLPCPDGRQLLPTSQSKGSRVPQDARDLTVSCSFSDWNSKSRETLDLPKQTAALTSSTSSDPLDKSASPDNSTHLRSLGMSRVLGRGDVNVHSLFEIEDLHDKELEEAQEKRRRCEIEERNALKAYRRAQRALSEANARCTYLYRRREFYSAELRSLVMEDSSLLWSCQQRHTGDTWNLSNTASDVDLDLIPGSSRQKQAEFEAGDGLHYDSNAQSADGDAH